MSEYQYFEFLAVDRPLDARQQAEVRVLSTRARITATSFVNEYHWGNFGGDPSRMMERYYDAHLYLTNWGSRRIMLRMPRSVLDLDTVEQYCVGEQVEAWTTGDHLIVDFSSEDDSGDWDEDAEGSLSAIIGVRAEIAAGDLRPLYLAWLAGYGTWQRDEYAFDREEDGEPEPLVPPGLRNLTAAQQALADFLRLDDVLLAVAATTSPSLEVAADDPRELTGWIANMAEREKDRLLLRVVMDHPATVRLELLRRFRHRSTTAVAEVPRRTVAQILDAAANQHAEHERQAAVQRAEQEAARARAHAVARTRRLNDLSLDEDAAWARVNAMIATRKPAEYDAAVALLTDLRALADRDGHPDTFARRSIALREEHARKPSLVERLNAAGIGRDPEP